MSDAALLARCEADAHRLYYEQREGFTALMQWRIRSRLGAPTLDSQLALGHCEIEAGQPAADLPPLGIADPTAADGGRARAYAELILGCAWTHYVQGDLTRATRLARLVAAVDPHLRSVYETQILAPAGAAGGLPGAPGAADRLPFERALRLTDADARALVAPHRGKRVLLFMPGRPGEPEGALLRQLRTSLEALGLSVGQLDSLPSTGEAYLTLADRLQRTLAEQQPDLLVAYDLAASGATAYPEFRDALLGVIETARRDRGMRVAVTYSDAWYDGVPALMDALAGRVDLFHIPYPSPLPRLSAAARARSFCYPYPVDDPRPAGGGAPAGARDRAAFVGGVSWANLSRFVWCAEIARAGLPVDIHLTSGGPGAGFRSAADYAALLAAYPVALNLVARINGDRIMAGRAIEAPWVGALLLEEASDDTAWFLRPGEHYVPFASFAELADRLPRLLADAPLRAGIARAGQAWVQRHFGGLHFWARLFHRLYDAPPPPAVAPGDLAGLAVRFPHSAQTYLDLARPLAPLGGLSDRG